VLCLSAFYRFSSGSCLEISAKGASFGTQAPGLGDSASAKAIEVRHQQWAKQLPKGEDDLWDALAAFDADSRAALFAHCASLSVNAVHEPWSRSPRRLAHADTLARALRLDMAAAARPTRSLRRLGPNPLRSLCRRSSRMARMARPTTQRPPIPRNRTPSRRNDPHLRGGCSPSRNSVSPSPATAPGSSLSGG